MASQRVRASVLHGERDLRLEERELPPPANDEVQVAVQSTGLCGSDLHYFNHFRNGDILVREPLTLGHESSGTVVGVGSAVSDLKPGDRVALEVGLPCEECEYCQQGRYNICRDMRFRSSAKAFPHAQGTLQERLNHPARWCHKLPDGLSLDLGAVIEPLSVAMHAQDRASLPAKSTVLVFGAGAVGLLAAAVSKASDAEAVVIADIQKDRVDFAVANGYADTGFVVPMARPQTIDEKLAYAQDVAAKIMATEIRGKPVGEVSAVYECTGVETCLQSSIYATKPGGKVMIIGMGTPIITLPMSAAALREVDLIGVFRYANTYKEAIKLLSNRPASMPDLATLVTHRFKGMDHITDAFSMAAKVKDGAGRLVLKVVVDMEEQM
ncbi:alcohol dehydrogenase groES-like domain-containing protein [Hirsutella rhossiliensis]|uniref:Alcohol dehydrogenase groES-like domain-containing protein n=1 Tax=Hirsutella rhossiliensis TaxID=111463 RepID=A0A9P8SEE5_9HYPO|nr:alcohol dehydrogenase groES-like domain-containing protein [Hirsutella rhossiliensis]KAH0958894.1 alcohol dehydrogenase groES-like domain-containing protein [Hirsutella rhossiliensis]